MKTAPFITTLLIVIAFCLVSEHWVAPTTAVHAATASGATAAGTMTRNFEYLTIVEEYNLNHNSPRGEIAVTPKCYVHGNEEACPKIFDRYGAQGWEMVSAFPVSIYIGPGMSGTTSAEHYIFKRPLN